MNAKSNEITPEEKARDKARAEAIAKIWNETVPNKRNANFWNFARDYATTKNKEMAFEFLHLTIEHFPVAGEDIEDVIFELAHELTNAYTSHETAMSIVREFVAQNETLFL